MMQINNTDIEKIVQIIKENFQNEIYKERIEFLFISNIEKEDTLKTLVEMLSKENIHASYAISDKMLSGKIGVTYFDKYVSTQNMEMKLCSSIEDWKDILDDYTCSWSIRQIVSKSDLYDDLIESQDGSYYSYLSETELKRKIKYAKNPLEKQRLERELGKLNSFSRHNKATKKNKRRKKQ